MADEQPPAGHPGYPRLESAAKSIQLLTLPVVSLFLLALFFKPMMIVARDLPAMVENASELSAAGFSVKIRQAADRAGSPEVAEAIGALSKDAVRFMLGMSDSTYRLVGRGSQPNTLFPPEKQKMEIYLELEKAEILDCDGNPISKWQEDFNSSTTASPDKYRGYRVPKSGADLQAYPFDFSCTLSKKGQEAAAIVFEAVSSLASRQT